MEHFQFDFFGATEADSTTGKPSSSANKTDDDIVAQEIGTHEALPGATEQLSEVQLLNSISLQKGTISSKRAATMLNVPELHNSDLVPQKYEGGFKLWEGAIDLCNYLIQIYQMTPDIMQYTAPDTSLRGKKVLELGCGHGLPGILCLLAGATVHYQDYNKQVMTSLTIPNVQANLARVPQGGFRERARYFAGDWQAVGQMLAMSGLGGHYDIILTAETIYSLESQEHLLGCIKQVLQPPHGTAYVAAKSFYFGVGGSTTNFAELVKADGILECSQVWKVEDGQSNKREILKLSFPESITPYFL
eukprot:GHRR01004479.1.p1 GENE.GHRR01004479.1~~GHRR01004479.1.p1  ORF type:complete len:304 (+),score=70.11 GHRR01004479.1:120-1031(+)